MRVRASAVRTQASNLANALATRKTLPQIERRVRAQSKRAARVAAALERLQRQPSGRANAGSVEPLLAKLGGCT